MDKNCPVCFGVGWVCENHPDRAWHEELEGCNTPLVRGQREPLDGADAATMTLDHLGAKMRCDKCGNWPLLTKFGAVIEVLG